MRKTACRVVPFVLLVSLSAQAPFVRVHRDAMPDDGANSQRASLLDADGDGDLDVVCTGPSPALACRIYRNLGRGNFTLDSAFAALGLVGPHLAADVDGDGDSDLLLPGKFLQNRGALGWLVTNTAMVVTPIAFGDVDGDLIGDVIGLSGQVSVLLGNGAGGFSAIALPAQGPTASDASLVDLDVDGDLDLLITVSPQLVWPPPFPPGFELAWRNNGNGTFTDVSATWLPGAVDDFTEDMVVGDFDGDGDQDAAFLSAAPGATLSWGFRRNDGTGRLVPWTGPSVAPLNLRARDLDADGDVDLVRNDAWFVNDGAANFTARVIAGSPAELLDVGDVDGDADLDLLLGGNSWNGFGNRVLLDDGGQQFVDATAFPWNPDWSITGSAWNAGYFGKTIAGDVDGDGDHDLLSLGGSLAVNRGDGWFDNRAFPWQSTSQFTYWARLVDLDGDSDLDAVYVAEFLGATPQLQLRTCRNLGNGVFVDLTATIPAVALAGFHAGTMLDADGDGDLDLATIDDAAQMLALYVDSGGGVFQLAPAAMPVIVGSHTAIESGDFDQDGDADLIVTSAGFATGASAHMLVNNGSGMFVDTPSRLSITGPLVPYAAVVLDIDHDTDLDAVLGPSIFLNDGNGRLVMSTSIGVGTLYVDSLAVGDLDGDGRQDLVAKPNGGSVHYCRNQGGGLIQSQGSIAPLWSTYQPVSLVDVDDDGDADLVLGSELWPNRRWHVEAPDLPRLGANYRLRFGSSDSSFTFAIPFLGAWQRTPLPPLGTLCVAAASALVLPPIPMVAGSATWATTIPNAPALFGADITMQALLVAPSRLRLTPGKRETVHR
jgi:FG-GAP-like repeat/FG-GAP repeat